jgi:hypothetical protein
MSRAPPRALLLLAVAPLLLAAPQALAAGDAAAVNGARSSSSSSPSSSDPVVDGRTLPLAGAPATSAGRGRPSSAGGFTADGFRFGFGGLGPLNLGPGGFGPQIYEAVFGSNLNTGFVASASQATSSLAGPDAGGPLRDALFAVLPRPLRDALGADVVSLVGYDAGDRLLGGLFGAYGAAGAVGELVPAGCIGPIVTLSLASGVCTVDGGGGGGDEKEGGEGKGGGGGEKAPAAQASSFDGGGQHHRRRGGSENPPAPEEKPARSAVTCTPPVASLVATPLACNLPYRSAAQLAGPALGGVRLPLAPARAADLLGAPLALGAGAALNVTRLYLGYSGATRRLLNDLGVYRWYNYAGQVAAAELLRIQAAIIAGATPALRSTSAGRVATPFLGGVAGGGAGSALGLGALVRPRGAGLVPRGAAGSGLNATGGGAEAAAALAAELMQRQADALPPLLRSAAAALAGAAAATRGGGGSAAAAGAREVAEAADELGRRIAARLGVEPGGGLGGVGSGVALLSALARGDLAGVRRALGRAPAQVVRERRAAAAQADAAAAAAAAATEAAAGKTTRTAQGDLGGGGDDEKEAPPPPPPAFMSAAEQQAFVLAGGSADGGGGSRGRGAGSTNPYRRHMAAAAEGSARAGRRLARSTSADAAAQADAAGGPDAGDGPPSQPSAAERAQAALDPMLVSGEDVGADVIRAIMGLAAGNSPAAAAAAAAGAGPPPPPPLADDDGPPSSAPAPAPTGGGGSGGGLLLSSDADGQIDLAAAVAAETARAEEEGGGGGGGEEEQGGQEATGSSSSGSDGAAAGDRRRRRRRRRLGR